MVVFTTESIAFLKESAVAIAAGVLLLGGESPALAAVNLASLTALGVPTLVNESVLVSRNLVDLFSVGLGVRDKVSVAAELVTARSALGDHFRFS